ncbi:MAG: hypothetical protein SOW11_00860, partial [Campylobacter lanienae]|nr:hypothetical protein [Campylobacter lanienae]
AKTTFAKITFLVVAFAGFGNALKPHFVGYPYKNPWRSRPLEGFYRGLGVVKGEAKALLSFVASQTMIYIVLLLRYSSAKKRSPSPLKKKRKFKFSKTKNFSKNLEC